jgi:DNA-binding response OmpR family regulator
MKLLVVEDDVDLAAGLVKALRREGFSADAVGTGREAMHSIDIDPPDLVILDRGLPDMDGIAALKMWRAKNKNLPVLILTARGGLEDKVNALDLGADDYLAKPFEMAELLARLRVLLRRMGTALSSYIHIGDVRVDLAGNQASLGDEDLKLSRREFMLLRSLMENAGRIQTKESLEKKLYGWGEEIASNVIEVHISNLRKKLPADFIHTVRGVGYTIAPQ